MKILFSPSEAKYNGGDNTPIQKTDYLFPELFDKRLEIITQYKNYIEQASNDALSVLFGTKKQTVIDYYKTDIFQKKTMKTVERYDGVAYDYLAYGTLNDTQKSYIDNNIIIFSNLFGPLLAGDEGLPDYKLKQGAKINNTAVERFYKEHFTPKLNDFLSQEPYLDLRAGFYNKFYKPTSPHTTLKFIKDGKVVSHWAKAYRGIVLRQLALHQIETIEEFMAMEIENLNVKEICSQGHNTQIIYDITV